MFFSFSPPLVVGLTGSIGVGKSFVSSCLAKDEAFAIIDYDLVARAVVEPGTWGLRRYVQLFAREAPGVNILTPEGTLDRKVVSTMIFAGDEGGKRLLKGVNKLLRLPILLETARLYLCALLASKPIVVLDAPLLFEAGLDKLCSLVLVVFADEQVQIKRVMERDSFTAEDAKARIAAQMPQREKVARADIVLDNSGSDREAARLTIANIAATIKQKAQTRKRRLGLGVLLVAALAVVYFFLR